MQEYYIGLMSGTSLDGADGVLVDFSGHLPRVMADASEPFSDGFRAELLALNTPSFNELNRSALAAHQLATVYARVVHALLLKATAQGIALGQIQAVGAHGQTIRHQPLTGEAVSGNIGYTMQLNHPSLLAELTGLDVVADFRSRDVAAGGQGAPLVPAFHQGMFGRDDEDVAVLNLGGIANLSVLPAKNASPVLGFDCGPGNALMDAWCQRNTGHAFDAGGTWAASGKPVPQLLATLLSEAYFSQPIPKSTGRDLFSLAWLAEKLAPFASCPPADIQNTLTEFTASACVTAIENYAAGSKDLIVCGGGAFNLYLLQRLQAGLPWLRVSTSDEHGLPPLQVEAAAFAWLARQMIKRLPGNLPSATGATGPRVLGALYPA